MQVSIKAKSVKIDYCGDDYMGCDSGVWRLQCAYYACNDSLRDAIKALFSDIKKIGKTDTLCELRAQLIERIEHCPIIRSTRVYS